MVKYHRKLWDSHKKIKKKNKKRDKFFRKMSKRVTGLGKVLNPQDKQLSPRVDTDYEVSVEWLGFDADVGGAESAEESRS